MQTNVYTRERKHIGSIWSRVTCLALPLAAAQGLGSRAPKDSQSRRCLMTKQIVPKDATHRYERVSVRIT
jgi:hypothetical protein